MEFELVPHPSAVRPQLELTVEVARIEKGAFILHYACVGDVDVIRVPEPARYTTRDEGLWQSTCFEAFIAPHNEDAYVEFNFAPSTAWDAFGFTAYRRRQATTLHIPRPVIDVDRRPSELHIYVTLDLTELGLLRAAGAWRLALAAVIEETDGTKSYWALAHAPGPPDFHNPACFTAAVPAPPAP